MERIIEVDLEIGDEEINDEVELSKEEQEELQLHIELFLEDLADLCNAYGIVITGCDDDCGIAVIEGTERYIERYELHAGHILPIYTESAKVA